MVHLRASTLLHWLRKNDHSGRPLGRRGESEYAGASLSAASKGMKCTVLDPRTTSGPICADEPGGRGRVGDARSERDPAAFRDVVGPYYHLHLSVRPGGRPAAASAAPPPVRVPDNLMGRPVDTPNSSRTISTMSSAWESSFAKMSVLGTSVRPGRLQKFPGRLITRPCGANQDFRNPQFDKWRRYTSGTETP
jgi:hypothetical protein